MNKKTPSKDNTSQKLVKSDSALREEKILEYWQENNIFEKSLAKDSPNGEFVFYDGPPFATGLPHYGSLLSSITKDVIPRYKTMQGYYVRRRWGWDCHGLPIENMIEKELGLVDKTEIEKMGVAKFNQACRDSVLRYAGDWKEFIDRVGRWVEYDNAYMTMNTSYIESVWWALSQLHKKGLLYEGRKVLPYCPHCQTPIAKAEIQMDNSYRDVVDQAVTVKFRLVDSDNEYFLAWTTTPWTLPGNVALAIGADISYQKVKVGDDVYILAKDLVEQVMEKAELTDYEVVETMTGADLVGLSYESLYPYDTELLNGNEYKVYEADFVNTESGTGIVHTAVIYGEDDYELGLQNDLPVVQLLDEKAHFNDLAPEFIRGEYFKKAQKLIKNDLDDNKKILITEDYKHSYPHCHRCGTALLYNALVSWFIDIQQIKKTLLSNNEEINWVPEHLKHGRFENIVSSAPDWTLSRNRYWASPLPIWKSKDGEVMLVDSVDTLLKYSQTSANQYIVMRHGESESNVKGEINSKDLDKYPLTEKGKEEVKNSNNFDNIDLIITSPFIRAKESAEIVANQIGIDSKDIIIDERLKEIDMGLWDGKSWKDFFESNEAGVPWGIKPEGYNGESRLEVKQRSQDLLAELEQKYSGKTILLVTHGASCSALKVVSKALTREQAVEVYEKEVSGEFIKGEMFSIDYLKLPRDESGELDLHRPYIDDIVLEKDGKEYKRIPEVIDGWFESASMPFAEYHYPFENKDDFEKRFPGDFVAEYIAQTRTWFYYMHVVATALFGKQAFNNVITTGTILASDGAKMSKSKKNYTDPMIGMGEYSADALRYYLMTSVVMQAEDLRFSDEEVREAQNRFLNLFWNSYKFYDMYTESDNVDSLIIDPKSNNVLDKWIIARLNETHQIVTEQLDKFNTVKAGRPLRDLVNDLSTWYIRRSRDRYRSTDEKDMENAKATTRYVLFEVSKLCAPFIPFLAESIYQGLNADKESVHLEAWSDVKAFDKDLLDDMVLVREVVSEAMKARDNKGFKVRQPLARLIVKSDTLKDKQDFIQLIMDEVNIKEVIFDSSATQEIELDFNLTPELVAEGQQRELLRLVQSLRKDSDLVPTNSIKLQLSTLDESQSNMVESWREELKLVAGVDDIEQVSGLKTNKTSPILSGEVSVSIQTL